MFESNLKKNINNNTYNNFVKINALPIFLYPQQNMQIMKNTFLLVNICCK